MVKISKRKLTIVRQVPQVEWCSLQTLRCTTNVGTAVTIQRSSATFNHIDFRSTACSTRSRVIRARTGTSGKPHTGQPVDTVKRTLVWGDACIAAIMVAIWPHPIGGSSISRTSQVTHCPETRPESFDVSITWEGHASFETAPLEAKLVPALYHPGSVVKTVILKVIESKLESAFCRGYCVGVIPLSSVSVCPVISDTGYTNLFVLRYSIPDIDCLEERVIVLEERSAGHVKLVGELQCNVSHLSLLGTH